MCDHEWIFIMGEDIYRGHVSSYKRVHWCWKCGMLTVSFPNYHEKDYIVGKKPEEGE